MRHAVDGRKFGRNTSHRLAMFRNMANSVIVKEQIVTSVAKAKEIRRVVDRLITLAKSGTPAHRRLAFDRTRDDAVVKKLFTTLSERYAKREGGYTRVIKMASRRWGDAAEMAVLELVDRPELDRKRKPKSAAADKAKAEDENAPKESFGRFRKLFSQSSKGSKASGPTARKGAKASTGASRKTMSGGSGGSG